MDLIEQFLGSKDTEKHGELGSDMNHNSAFVSLLTNDSFYPGVEALCKSIRATNSGTQ